MKECISERDHYRTFPRKNYPLSEECDLLEIESAEVAYCLCRSDLCNEKPIADQFIAFEEQHPELFGDTEGENSPETLSNDALSESESIGVERIDSEQELPLSVESERRRQPSASTTDAWNEKEEHNDPDEINIAPTKVTLQTTEPGLLCMQCGQGNLNDAEEDCEKQIVVECNRRSVLSKGEQHYCFTRQIVIGPGRNAVEKMCVTHMALIQEYGADVDLDGCTLANADHVRFCVCQTNECNRATINEQMIFKQEKLPNVRTTTALTIPMPPHRRQPVTSCYVCSENNLSDADADCSRPIPLDCNQQFKDGSGSLCLTRRTQLTPAMYSLEKRCMSRKELNQNPSGPPVDIGCGDAYDGLVVYCICEGEFCNREGMMAQLQKDIKYLSNHKLTTKAISVPPSRKSDPPANEPIIQPGSSRRQSAASASTETATQSGQLQRPTEQTITAVIVTAAPKRKADERFAVERQQRWRNADEDNFNSATTTCSICTAPIAFLASAMFLLLS
ncbi:hypothetical protein Tcan_09228 [Toxocara canis]|uniref:Uncharacterized protein n=1 Tax=Toxocara canis TaxID=6265 RepID=A0A0B2VSV0_TOXCA|nr:hypothetical protein Tcan_09228 [Toxocara canis]